MLSLFATQTGAVEVQIPSSTITGGSLNVPFGAAYSTCRLQSIYLASEIGTTGKIRSLTFTFNALPGQPLTNLTIRMKQTALASFSTLTWETGFTTVYAATTTISATGARTFIFTTPFNYTGGTNLMVDISFQNSPAATVSSTTNYTNSSPSTNRSMFYRDTTGAAGAPLSWTSTTPAASSGTWNPNIYLGISPNLFVKPAASGKGDGSDWANALGSLSTALTNSTSGDDIWVAAGTYKPTTTATRTIYFTMKSGVGIYGGFAGTETALSQRSPSTNLTTLSGDIGTGGVSTDNSYHVVSCTTSGTLDGFTVRDGTATGVGSFEDYGGGMLINGASATPTVANCIFLANTATLGGAMMNYQGAPTLTSCVFSGNSSSSWGGAMFNYSSAVAVTYSNLVFQGNTAGGPGGAMANQSLTTMNLVNSTLYGNSSSTNAGAIYFTSSSNATLTNCILWGNTAGTNPQIDAGGNSVVSVNGVFEGGMPAGVTNSGSTNLFTDPLFFNTASPAGADGRFATYDDGLNLGFGSPDFNNGATGAPVPATDVVGRARPYGTGIDRGAYERPTTIYVNDDAAGLNNGGSWVNAYTDLQSALTVALAGDQIWVAAGTYNPGSLRTSSFIMKNGVAIYGGFAGSETLLSQRVATANQTTLSGDIGTIAVTTDNCYNVVTGVTGGTLDGFIVRDGNANGSSLQSGGGGMVCSGASPSVSNCVFTANLASYAGGAIYITASSSPSVTNCVFAANGSSGLSCGGAFEAETNSSPIFRNCTFNGNMASVGGAFETYNNGTITLINCIIWGNDSISDEVYNNGTDIDLQNCILKGGTDQCSLPGGTFSDSGGNLSSDPRFVNVDNLAGPDGQFRTGDDGLVIGGGSPAINAGTASGAPTTDLLGNSRPFEGAHDIGAFEVDIIYVKTTATGAGTGNSWADACTLQTALAVARPAGQIWVKFGTYKPTATADRTLSFTMLKGCGLYGGFAGSELLGQFDNRSWVTNQCILSGDIGTASVVTDNSYHVVVGASAPFDGFVVRDGYADGGGGLDISTGAGMFNTGSASPLIANCVFTANAAPNYTGGAIVNGTNSGSHSASPRITNCVFTGNSAAYGGAFFGWSGCGAQVVNCTFSANTAGGGGGFGGVLYSYSGSNTSFKNCILWGDSAPTGPEIYAGGGTAVLTSCTIQGGIPGGITDGGGNLVTDPLFANAASPAGLDGLFVSNDDGLRLLATSPAVNSGSSSGTDLPTIDLLRTARPLGGAYDRGAYEGKIGTVAFSSTSSSGSESVTSINIPVTLVAASDLTVTVNYSASGTGANPATGGGVDYTLASGTLTFTPGVTSQNIVLSVVSDAVVEPDETLTITLANPTNAILGTNTTHVRTIQNDDAAGITVSPTSGLVTVEDGSTDTFSVVLTSQPTGVNTVTVSFVSSIPAEGTVSTPSVTFTTGNWSVPQFITITGVNDFVDDGTVAYTIITSASSGDALYNAINPADVSVINKDDDAAGFVITPTSGLITTEAGAGTATFTVCLSSQPTGANTVTMSLTSSDTTEGTVSPSGLSFNSGNWNVPVTVTVTGVDDLVMDGNIAYSIVTGDAVSGDANYSGMVVTDVSVTNNDNDVAGVTFSKVTVTVSESGTFEDYTAVLTSQPVAAVTITFLSSDGQTAVDDQGTAGTQNTLSFDSSNWSSAKTVRVTAVNDLIVEGAHTGAITHALSSTDPNYNGIAVNGVTANITDNDTAGVTVTQSGGTTTVSEASPATGDTYTVSLNSQPLITPALLKDINAGASASSPASFTQVGSVVFFVATDATNGQELWKSDGTLAGTVLVKDIFPGATGSTPSGLTNVNGTLFFSANDGTNGTELWSSDGTAGGTTMVANIKAGALNSNPANLVNVAGTLFFSADTVTDGIELWKYVGGTASQVSNINPGVANSSPSLLTNVSGTLYFSATDGTNGIELWKSDGTGAGTTMVMNINSGAASSNPANLVDVGGTLFFSADNGSNGIELWKSVSGSTTQVANLNPGSASSSPGNLVAIGSTVYFSATDGTNGVELWKSDGATTTLIKNINPGSDSTPGNLVNVGGVLFFSANDGTNGRELWKSDGTTSGTVLVKDTAPVALNGLPNNANFTNVNGVLYFRANDSVSGMELWRSDGTAAGTVQVKDINPSGSASISGLTNAGGMLFFAADSGTTGSEAWIGGTASVTITATVSDGQTVVDTDLGTGGNQNTLTFTGANWNVAQTVTVYAVNDALYETNPHPGSITHASVSTGVLGNAAYNGVAVASVAPSITDNDTAPTVTFSAASQSSSEATASMIITVNQSAVSGLATSIPFSVGGTATGGGTDYSITASPVSIAAGLTSTTITITVVNDALNEANETVVVTMGSPTNATQGATITHTATITDNDPVPTVAFTTATQSGAESVGTMTVTAQLSAVSGQLVTIPFTLTGSSATGGGTDYTITASPVTIAAGSTTTTITITVINDVLDEADETVVVTMGTPTNAGQGATTVHTATITDDDATPTVTFTSASQSAAENVGAMTVTAQLSAVSGQLVTIPFTLTGSSATGGGTDYSITASPVTIAAGATTATITIAVNNDALDEADETVVVTMGTPTNAGQGVTTVHTATITDDDATPTVTFTAASQTVAESIVSTTITAQLSAASGQLVTIPFTLSGTATGSGTDYSITASPVTIAAGATTTTITVTVVDDALNEVSETVVVTMGSPTNAGLGATTVHTVTITDNDTAPTVAFTAASQSQAEEVATMTATLQLSAASGQLVTVPFTVGGTATGGGTDYTVTASPVTITAGATTTTVTITVVNDTLNEANETVVLTLGSPTNATVGGTPVHTATITNTDAVPTVQFTVASQSGAESVGTMTATVQLSAVSGQTVTVPFTLSGTATGSGTDYNITASPLIIAAGATTATATITVINDAVDEANETVVLTLNPPTNATASGTTVHTATITDDDTAGVTIVQSAGSTDISEAGPSSDAYTMVLNSQPLADVTITITPIVTGPGIQTTVDTDLGTAGNQNTLTFTSGNWNVAQTVTVTADNDAFIEGAHTGTITHSAGGEYAAVSIANVVANITDNDTPAILITETLGDTTVTEGGSGDTYTVVLAATPTATVTITINAGAQASVDQTTLIFTTTPGQAVSGNTSGWNVAQTVTVSAVDDALDETSPMTVSITHSAASSDTNYNGLVTGLNISVIDNDATPTLAIANASVAENAGPAVISVTMTGQSASTVSVDFATASGSAITGTDYTAATGTLTWTTGQTGAKTFVVTIANDALDEADETFTVSIANALNASIATPSATATITDDDTAPTIAFSTGSQSVAESVGTATITAQLSAISGQNVSMAFSVTGTAAGSGTDYTITASPLVIPAGSISGSLTVTIVDDALNEAAETVIVTQGGLTNATAAAPTAHTLTITDNDTAPMVAFTSAGQSAAESVATMTVTAQLSALSGQTVTVPFTVSGTATGGGTDFSITASPLTIVPPATSAAITITVINDALDEADETVVITMGAPTNASQGAVTVHTATINDDDAQPSVAFSTASQGANENIGTMTVTAQLSVVSGQLVTVPFTVSGTATGGGTDYTITASPVTIAAGGTTGTITITVNDDALDEANETVIVTMGSPTNATQGGTLVHTATITDNDATPTVTFTTGSQTAAENIGTMTITAQLSTVSGQLVTVPFTLTGSTATGGGTDYSITASPVTIAAGATTTTITVTVVDDALDESSETVVVTMGTPTNATQGATTVHTATITDNDATPTVTFTAASQTVAENVGSTTITAQLSAASGQLVTVPFSLSGTATGSGTDYNITASPVTITAGATTTTITVTVVDDVLNEASETVVVSMGSPTNAGLGATTVHTVTITDNDTAPTVAFTAASQSQAENLATMTATLQLSALSGQTVTVPFTVGGTATGSGTDYTVTASPVTITAGTATTTVTITVVNDALNEADETVVLTIGSPTNATVGGTPVHTATITNDDAVPTLQFTAASQSGAESVGTMTATVQLSAVSGQLVTIPFTLTGSTATGGGTDYSITASPLTIAAGATTTTATITVINDAVDEANETVVLTLGSPTNATASGTTVHTVTITDDDTVGATIVESGGSSNVSEAGPTSDTYTVVLTSQPTATVTITLTPNAQITVDTDLGTALDQNTLTFTTGNWNVAQAVTVTAVDDASVEGLHSGSISYAVAGGDYAGLVIPNLVASITDNDSPGVLISESAGSTNVTEGGAGDTYTVRLATLPTGTVTITVNPGSQCTASPTTLIFTTVTWNIPQTVTVGAIDDPIYELTPHSGTIGHTASSTDTNYGGIAISNVAVSITDNDAIPTIAVADVSVSEATATVTVTVTMTGTSAVTTTVNYATANDTALAAADYTATSGTLTWTPGQTGAKTFTVPILNDTLDEADETFAVDLSLATNATISDAAGIVTITDNDATPTVTFTTASQSVTEAAGSTTVTAQLSAVSGLAVTVPFTFTGSASAGSDYTSTASPLTITAGASGSVITVTIVDDALDEVDETIVVTMGVPTNASQGATTSHTITVTDNDATPSVSFASAGQSSGEASGTMTISVALSAISGQSVSIPFSLSGTATSSGVDYSITASPLVIAPGAASGTITITVVNDALDEADEDITVTLGAPTNATLGATTVHTATILDDDATPTVAFTAASQTVAENIGTMTITAQLSAVSGQSVTVPFTVTGSATGSGTDYTITASPVSIAAGAATATITVTVVDDALDEASETVVVTMGAPTNATPGATLVHTATITDNDATPTVAFTSASQTAAENIGTMTVTAQLSAVSGQSVTVPFTVTGSATGGGTDYTITASPVNIAAGATTTTITVTVVDDALDEPSETVVVTMGSPTNATPGATLVHTATITDNDATPTVTFTVASQSVAESIGSTTITAQLSAVSGQDVTVPFTVGGSATGSGTDYTITVSPVTISAGTTTTTITVTVVDDVLNEASETVVVTMGSPINAGLGATTVHTLTITDNDTAPTVAFTVASQAQAEEVATMTATLQLSAISGQAVTVPFTVGGTATGGGTDYTVTASPVVIAAGATTTTVTITVINDALNEANETVVLTLGAPTNATASGITIHTATITNTDAVPTVQFTAVSQSGAESVGTLTATVQLSAVSGQTVTVPFTLSGSASAGTDYTITASPLTIAAGATTATATITVINNAVDAADKDVVLTLGSSATVTASGTTVHTATIVDDDTVGVTIVESGGSTNVSEAGPTSDTYTMALTSEPTATVTVTLTPNAQVTVSTPSLTFTTANWNVTQTVTVTAVDDGAAEGLHTGSVTYVVAGGDYAGLSIPPQTVSITDNDSPGVLISESAGSTNVIEGGVGDTYTVRLATDPTNTVTITINPGSQCSVSPSTLTFTPGVTGNWNVAQTVNVSAIDDVVSEPSPHFGTISHTAASSDPAYSGIAISNVAVSITDNDAAPTLAIANVSALEGAAATVTATMTGTSSSTVTVAFTTVDGTATLAGLDYTAISGTLTWAPSETGAKTFTVVTAADALDEDDETVSLVLSSPVNATITQASAVLTITDNNALPTVAFTAAAQSSGESSGSTTATVQLSAISGRAVTIPFTLSGTATAGTGNDYTIATSPLTIPAGLLSTALAITVLDDAFDEPNETVIITLGAATNATVSGVTVHTVTITDDDATPTVGFTSSGQSADESSGTVSIAVVLSAVSGQDVSVPFTVVGSATGADYSISASPLVILAGAAGGTVDVTITDDALNEDDETVAVTLGVPTNATLDVVIDHTLTILDNDALPTVEFALAVSTALESVATRTITAQLSAASGRTITVPFTITGSAGLGSDYTVTASPLSFAPSATTASITITVINDVISEPDETVVVTMGSPTNATLDATTVHTATIQDDEGALTVDFDPATPTTAENGAAMILIARLSATSGLDVTVPFTLSGTATDGFDYTIDASPVVITAGSTTTTITITPIDDAVAELGETVIVTMGTPTNAAAGTTTTVITSTITDNDAASVTVAESGGTTAATEGGATDDYTVVLNSQPSGDVTITISVDAQVSVSPATLTFTAMNYNVAQTVTVTAVDDDVYEGPALTHPGVISHTATGGGYTGIGIAGVTAAITDNDVRGLSVVVLAPLEVSEDGDTDSFTVALTSQPTSDVTLTISSSDGQVSTTPAVLTFTAANWDTPQNLTLQAVNDFIDEASPHSGTITYTATGGGYTGAALASTAVAVIDNDSAGVTVIPASGLTTTEAGGITVFVVALDSQPTADVTINLTSSNPAEGAVSPSSITFTPANWFLVKGVLVTGVDDAIDDGDVFYSIVTSAAISADPGYNGMVVSNVGVLNIDNDSAGVTVTVPGSTSIAEASGSFAYSLTLNSQPTGNVTISTILDGQVVATPGSVIFTAGNWNVPQAISVTAVDDQVDEASPHAGVIVHSASGPGYSGVSIANVTAFITDNDTPGITVAPLTITVDESGTSQSFTAVLTSQPTSNVTLALTSTDTTEGTVSPSSLTFTPSNWNSLQSVIVTGVNDAIADGTVNYSVTTTAASSDAIYNGIAVSDVAASTTDDDVPGINVTPVAGLITTESAGSAVFTVVLLSQPIADVRIDMSSSNSDEGTVSPVFINFTSVDWNLPRNVTVTGTDDAVADGNIPYTIVLAPALSGDPNYAGRVSPSVSVTNQDNDAAGVILTQSGGISAIAEVGITDTYDIQLATQPPTGSPVTITITSDSQSTVSPTFVTFTDSDWNLPKTITITAVNDQIAEGAHTSVISHVASGGGYGAVVVSSLTALVTDNDTALIVVTPTAGLITTEAGGSDTFTVVLNSQPTGDVIIDFASNDPGEGTVSPTQVTFTAAPGSWDAPVTITVTGIPDVVPTVQGSVSYQIVGMVNAGTADATYSALSVPNVNVTGTDSDVASLDFALVSSLAETTEFLGANHTCTFDVTLTSQPTQDVTVSLVSNTPAKGTVTAGASLTFTSATWNVPQQVTLTGVNNHTEDGDSPYLLVGTANSVDSNYSGIVAQTTITSRDDHLPDVVVAAGGLSGFNRGTRVTIYFLDPVTPASTPNGLIGASDAETAAPGNGLIYTIQLVPGQGALRRHVPSEAADPVGTLLVPGATFTQAELINNQITYTHNGGTGGTDGFAFTVTDADTTVSALAVLNITINLGLLPPQVTLVPGPVAYTENAVPVAIDGADGTTQIFDPDSGVASSGQHFQGGNLTVTVSGGTALDIIHDIIGIRDQGTGTGQIGLGTGGTVTYGTAGGPVVIGTITSSGIGGPLTVTFTDQAHNTEATALLKNITFSNDSDFPSANARTITVTMLDAPGGASSTPATVTINVTPVNDVPTISAPVLSTAPSAALAGAVTAGDADLPLDTLAFSVPVRNAPNGPTKGTVTLNAATGTFSYLPDSGSTGIETFTVTVTDVSMASASAVVTVLISDPDAEHPWIITDPPMMEDGSTLSYTFTVDVSAFPQTPTPSALTYTLVGDLTPITTWSINPQSATSATLSLTHTALLGSYLTFGIVVTDTTNQSTGMQLVTLLIVLPGAAQ